MGHQTQGQPRSIRCRRRVAPAPVRPSFDRAPARLACDRFSRAPAQPFLSPGEAREDSSPFDDLAESRRAAFA